MAPKKDKNQNSPAKGKGKPSVDYTLPSAAIVPFKEFKDNELSQEFGISSVSPSPLVQNQRATSKPSSLITSTASGWRDTEVQPLPRSVRYHLHSWVRAEDLAMENWAAEVQVFEDLPVTSKIDIRITQISYNFVLMKSSFCRKMFTACYILERLEGLTIEHTWEGFSCQLPPEGWRAKNLIYSPGMKPGGGAQHRPEIAPNGCYMVRLYYVGAWRCVWVSDAVPVDASGNPLLPFYPLLINVTYMKATKVVPSHIVYLWPLLLCKALLKLAAPNMLNDEADGLSSMEPEDVEDEEMESFDIYHALTGIFCVWFKDGKRYDPEFVWDLLVCEVDKFTWDNDDDPLLNSARSKSKVSKKPGASPNQKKSMVLLTVESTQNFPAFMLPGITPAHAQDLLVLKIRDVPIKRPLPEPEVPLWKTYRWVEWARRHGLYDDYDFPRTKFIKVSGLMKLSFAPHLLDVMSTQSVTTAFRKEQEKSVKPQKDRERTESRTNQHLDESGEKEWIRFDTILAITQNLHVCYYPSMFEFTTGTNQFFSRTMTKGPLNRALDVPSPKHAPFYLQVDSGTINTLRITLSTVHPRVLHNCNVDLTEYVEPAYMILEVFEWFKDNELQKPYAYVETRCYNSVSATLPVGRHYCRVWVHSHLRYQIAVLSDSTLVLGPKDAIMVAANKECSWAVEFFNTVGCAFNSWIRSNRAPHLIHIIDQEFFSSYDPDLQWDPEIVGYKKELRHWMFRRAVEKTVFDRISESYLVSNTLRYTFMDPDFCLPPKPVPQPLNKNSIQVNYDECFRKLEKMDGFDEFYRDWCFKKNEFKSRDSEESQNSSHYNGEEAVSLEEMLHRIIKDEKERIYNEHCAATLLQANWRGYWARKCLQRSGSTPPEVIKALSDAIFGNAEGMSALMNNFFVMYPGAKTAYSVSSALGGVYGLQQYTGTVPVTPKCTWVPLLQGTFYCHRPVKVHVDITSSLSYNIYAIMDNDAGQPLPQVYNTLLTFNINPNYNGYTILGSANILKPVPGLVDVPWQLTVFTSLQNDFHPCDDLDPCTLNTVPCVQKVTFEEVFLPNRRNILGGVELTATKNEVIAFRAVTTFSELQLEAVLEKINNYGESEEVARISGKGEIFWPYIKIDGPDLLVDDSSYAQSKKSSKSLKKGVKENDSQPTLRKMDHTKQNVANLQERRSKLNPIPRAQEYFINVIAPKGWPLTIDQWKKVQEIRNEDQPPLPETQSAIKGKKTKETKEVKPPPSVASRVNSPDDAYTILETGLAMKGGVTARRQNARELAFIAEKLSWGTHDPNRNATGEAIRQEFRAEFLSPPTPVPSEVELEGTADFDASPSTSASGKTIEAEEPEFLPKHKFMKLPERFRDKFRPLPFLEECIKERNEDVPPVIITPDIAEAAVREREMRIENAQFQRLALQAYNEKHFLEGQSKRNKRLSKLNTSHEFNLTILAALHERDESVAREILERQLSANRKKQDIKSLTSAKDTSKLGGGNVKKK